MKNQKKRVLVFGTFDFLHPGHLWFFKQAKKYGDELVVVVTRDTRAKTNNKKPFFNETNRLALVQSVSLVNQAVLGDSAGHWTMIKKFKPDVICLGYDQVLNHPAIQKQLADLKVKPQIIKLKAHRAEYFSSSKKTSDDNIFSGSFKPKQRK